jgi:hypothetical protein
MGILMAIKIPMNLTEGDKGEVDGVEHHLDAHEQHDRVPTEADSDTTNHEEEAGDS